MTTDIEVETQTIREIAAMRSLTAQLHKIAPNRAYPDQAPELRVQLAAAADVHWADACARRRPGEHRTTGVGVHVMPDGTVHTSTSITFGDGARTGATSPTMRAAAVLTLFAITTVDEEV